MIFSFEVTLPPATPPKYRARYSLRGRRWFGGRRRRTKSDSPLITHSRSIPTAVVARFRQGASVVRRRRGAKGKTGDECGGGGYSPPHRAEQSVSFWETEF